VADDNAGLSALCTWGSSVPGPRNPFCVMENELFAAEDELFWEEGYTTEYL